MRIFLATCLIITFNSCLKKQFLIGDSEIHEDFENYFSIDDVVDSEIGKWSFLQITKDENELSLDSSIVFEGNYSLKCYALPSEDGTSKSGLANNDMLFVEGDIVQFKAMYYLVGTDELKDIFIYDLEESSLIGAGPGIRIVIDDKDGYLKIERKKMFESDVRQDEGSKLMFPRDEWVEVRVDVLLSKKKKGYIHVYQNGELLLKPENIQTLPTDKINLIQGTKGIYNSVQVGITANSPDNSATLYVDQIEITKL